MGEKDLSLYSDLPKPPEYVILLPETAQAARKLQARLQACLAEEDLSDKENLSSLTSYKILLLAELLIYRQLDLRNLIHKIQTRHQGQVDRQALLAAFNVIYDWCATGGVNAAKIGDPL